MRVVVLGGHGNFGARICRALIDEPIEIIATSRDPERGHRAAGFGERIHKAKLDISAATLDADVRRLAPDVVIHCVGPFQDQDYRVARASLEAGSHYIDLSDAREFVARFAPEIDPLAKRSNHFAVTGASTVPALSSAVVDHLSGRLSSIDEIQICIAPAQHAPRGEATLRAVFSYAGKPFKWWENGSWTTVHGWQALRRMTFAEMPARWAAACDIPDLGLFPARYPSARTIQFRAALEVGIQHFLLAGVSQLRRWGLAIPLERWAKTLDRFAGVLDRCGSRRGGMSVKVTGTRNDGKPVRLEWHLTADNNHGPEIPCMPAILIAKKLIHKKLEKTGAMPCMGLLTLEEFAPQFARWGMRTNIEEVVL